MRMFPVRTFSPDSWDKGLYRKHPGGEHSRPFPGAFQDLPFWNKREGKGLHCISRLYDQKYHKACGSGGTGSG